VSAPDAEDRALFKALADGGPRSEKALKDLYDKYARRLLGLLRSKGYALQEAEDIVQDSFLKIYRTGTRLEEVDSPKAYLYRIVINCATDFLRRKAKAAPEVGVDPMELAAVADNATDIVGESFDGFMDCFEAAFDRFEADAPDRAIVVRLAIIEGMNGQELADAIGRSYGAAREFLSQTRKKFQQVLETMCGDYMPAEAAG
jgi:RNA polymerase sigma-70 factor, ECF subfamily